MFPFLDRLLPIVIQINPNIAKAAVQEGINYQQHDREYIWHPHDLHTNPVYQGVREPEIWNL